ncbi:O-antigen ligase family protein [Leminorella grimontii]|uniref:O-antigen ligase family protein n=1 Tax=Leminorella grimontii TaxID=82981 RepID=UPI00322009D6
MNKFITISLCSSILLLHFIGFIFIPIDPNVTNKIIIISGGISFLIVISNVKILFTSNPGIPFFYTLLILGFVNLLWYGFYKSSDSLYVNAYRGYLEMGKIAVFGAFSFLVLTSTNVSEVMKNHKIHLIVAAIGQVICFGCAFYQGVYLGVDRIPLSAMSGVAGEMGAATIAAYMLTFSSGYATLVLLRSDIRYKTLLFSLNFFLSFSAIIMTGTRAAIIAYPVMIIMMLIIDSKVNSLNMKKACLPLLALFIICGFIFKDQINERVKYFHSDISNYEKENSDTSIGARLAMIEAGVASSYKNFFFQSLEKRADAIKSLNDLNNNKFYGATVFLNVHLHNEIVEALSTKGIFGVILLFLFYFSLIRYIIKIREPILLSFVLAMFLFGLSDVIMHAKPIPSSWIITLYLSCAFLLASKKSGGQVESGATANNK